MFSLKQNQFRIAYTRRLLFSAFVVGKVDPIQATTLHASTPLIIMRDVPPFGQFQEVTLNKVINMMCAAPSKHCAIDLAPIWLVKRMSDILGPAITKMVNLSFDLIGPVITKMVSLSFDLLGLL